MVPALHLACVGRAQTQPRWLWALRNTQINSGLVGCTDGPTRAEGACLAVMLRKSGVQLGLVAKGCRGQPCVPESPIWLQSGGLGLS